MKVKQNTWKDVLFTQMMLIAFVPVFLKDSFIISSPRHWLIVLVIAVIALIVLMAYKHIIIWCYKQLHAKFEKPFMSWAAEFQRRPMNVLTIATIFGIAFPLISAAYGLVFSLVYLMSHARGLFNVLAAF